MVLTYGKKRNSVLPSLSIRRVSDGILKAKSTRNKNHVSEMPVRPAIQTSDCRNKLQNAFFSNDYNIDELASMLLEDTVIEQITTRPGNVDAKDQLPQPSPSASSSRNGLTWYESSSEETLSTIQNVGMSHVNHVGTRLRPRPQNGKDSTDGGVFSAPPIPRKSSKRIIGPTNRSSTNAKTSNRKGELMNQNHIDQFTIPSGGECHNDNLGISAVVPRVLKSNANEEEAFGRRKQVVKNIKEPRVSEKMYSVSDDKPVSPITIRKNEGKLPSIMDNLNNPKILSHIGFDIDCKLPSDCSESSKPYKPSNIGSSTSFIISGYAATTSKGEEVAALDDVPAESIPALIPKLTYSSYGYHDEQLQQAVTERALLGYDIHPDALISSSPIAQSTPRIQRTKDDESTNLGSRSGESRIASKVDRPDDHLMHISNPGGADVVKRNNSQAREAGATMKAHLAKRIRKRLSSRSSKLPEEHQDNPRIYDISESVALNEKNRVISSLSETKPDTILTPKDPNSKSLQPLKRSGKRNGSEMVLRPESSAPLKVLSREPKRAQALKPLATSKRATISMLISKPERRIHQSHSTQYEDSDSMMDTDELQWEDPAYNIGMRRI
ncbi:hypothetical protein B7463_g12508, partial [Scytalidium lignicola]